MDKVDIRNEPVTGAAQSLNEAWICRVIAKCGANLMDSFVQALIELSMRFIRPEQIDQIVAFDDLPRFLQEPGQKLCRLLFQPEA
jgi:hypothetical protein